jgi:hypothetical protein
VLHYVPQRRADIDIVEEGLPLSDVRVGIRSPKPLGKAYLVPHNEELPIRREGDYTAVTIPIMKGHAHIAFET